MSLLKTILSPFVEFTDEPTTKDAAPQPARPVAAPATPVTTYQPPAPDQPVDHPLISGTPSYTPQPGQPPVSQPGGGTMLTKPLPEHEQYFERLIEEANAKNPFFEGTDYKEFVDSKFDIDNIVDEETRYKTAFNVLKRTGLTKEKLLSTAQEYHNIVGRDMNAFQGAHSQKYQSEVRAKEQLIQKNAEELQALSQRMNELKSQISKVSQELTETKDKLNLTKNSFLLAGENKQHEIQVELEKIQKYF